MNVLLPTFKGLTWTVTMGEEFSTLSQKAVAPGFDTRVSLGPDPLFHFECNYEALREKAYHATVNELRSIEGFFKDMKGDFHSFLLSLPSLTQNPDDGIAVAQALTADGAGYAPLVIVREGHSENIYEAAGVNGNPGTAPVLKMGGTPLVAGTDYTWQGPGVAHGDVSYPGLVAVISAAIEGDLTCDFTWYYRVKFEQPKQDFKMFCFRLWELQQMKLITTRTQ